MGAIADVFLRALLEDKQLQIDAQKSGDKAGQTMGQRMSKGISVAMRAGLGIVSAGAAIATKGLVELDDTMAQFTADTGLAGDEAEKARKSILAMSSRNIQPMKEIGAVLAKVHTDLGLTGDAADATAEKFLHFARVTGKDASEEVKSFDDILDAWGLTADKSAGLMDQLIASHQKYGGVISEDEDALKNLAPAMKALNFNVDDTIGLLNLFKTKGLDAATTQRAFNTAVKNLPPGTSLQDVLDKISAIPDPAKRAEEAIRVFGSRGGVALANALGPGIGALSDYVITTDEATGATDKARDSIDSTFGNRAQLLLKGFTTKLTELGSAFGPAITGLASLASLGGSLGFGKLTGALSKGLAGAWKGAVGSAVVKRAIAAGASLAATLYIRALYLADALSGVLSGAWGKVVGASVVKAAIARASSAAATAYLSALIVGDAISGALSGAWMKVAGPGSKAMAAAGTAGKAAGLAFKIGMVLAVAEIADAIQPSISKAGADLHKALGLPDFDLHPEEWPWPLGPKDAPEWAGGGPTPLREFPGKVADDLAAGAPVVAAAAATMTDGIPTEMNAAQDDAAAIAKATPYEIAKSLREGADPVKMAAELLKESIKNALTPTREIAQLEGELTGKELTKALNSKRPEVRAAAQAYKDAIEERLFALRNDVPSYALRTGQNYADALEKKKGQVASAAQAVTNAARAKIRGLQADAYDYGRTIGQNLTNGLLSKLGAFGYATALYGQKLYNIMHLSSPAKEGPLSVDGGPGGWGERYAELYTEGVRKLIPSLGQVFANMPTPGVATPAFAMAGAGAIAPGGIGAVPVTGQAAGGVVINGGIHVDARGNASPAATGLAVQQGVSDAMAGAFRDQSLRGLTGTKP